MNPNERILHYRILSRLGAGGMGEVYLAEDEKLGRRVALKFLPRVEAADPERRERLRREARALASLSHPGIAGVYALEEYDGRLFLAMESIEGETLAQRIARRPLPIAEVVRRGGDVAEALSHAHARGVIHRDVKPSNILIAPDGATKLADFGLAVSEGETRLTAEGSTAGTADYMSPEQTRVQEVDRRSDLFSLGVVLYEALTGVRPFARPTLEGTFHAIRADDPEPPTALRTGVPFELERIVVKLLRKEPGSRFQTADDLAADLRTLGAHLSIGKKLGGPRSRGAGAYATNGGGGLDDLTATIAGAAPVPTSDRRRPRRLLLLIPALLLFVALAYLLSGLRPHEGVEAVATQRSIAVVSFQNVPEPGDPRREAVMAASLLTVGLGQSQAIPIVGAQRVHDVLRQLGKADQAVSGTDALLVGKRAGATYVVTGYVFQTSPTVVLGAEVASVADGAVLTSRRVQVPAGDQAIFAAVDSLTIALRDALSHAGFGVRSTPVDVAGQTTRNAVAYRAYAHGLDLLYHNEWPEARDTMLSAVAADSTFAQAWYHLAVATWWTADFPEAAREVETGLRLGSKLSERDREGMLALHSLVLRDWDDARERYARLTERYPDDKEFWYGLGEARFHGGRDYPGAKVALERALALDPQFGVTWVHILDIDIENDDLAASLADTERFRRLDPANPSWITSKVVAFGALGYPDSSIAYCRELLRAVPRFWVYRQMAILHAMSGQVDSARALVPDIARTAGPAAPVVPHLAGTFLAMTSGRFGEAERLAASGMRQLGSRPVDPYSQLLEFRMWSLLELGRKEEAVRLALEGVSLPPPPGSRFAVARSEVIEICLRAGYLAEARRAMAHYDRTLGPKRDFWLNQDRNYATGLIALSEGRPKESVSIFRTSLPLGKSLDSRDVHRRWALARALLAAGDHDGAIAELEKVSRRMIWGADAIAAFDAMILLAKEYEKLGRGDDALALYRRVAFQYRNAEAGLVPNEEAKAGVRRLEAAKARSRAS